MSELTFEQLVEAAKKFTKFGKSDIMENVNCDQVAIAYEWLDAQTKINSHRKHFLPIKHMIENWGSYYISTPAVKIAATMHKDIFGEYGYYNIASKLILPSTHRLINIASAGKHGNYYIDHTNDLGSYSIEEKI